MSNTPRKPVVVIVRDGWGRNPNPEHNAFNAVHLARTPRCDALLRDFPWTLIHTSGEDVGLPDGTMGNSEVGHQNLGAGRIVDQESVRITKSIRDGSFAHNPVLRDAIVRAQQAGGAVHILGLASDAGVHARLEHLYATLDLCAHLGHPRVFLHLFTDGRDTGPFTGRGFIREIEAKCATLGRVQIASLCGRYYALDRDNRWERVERAYSLLTRTADAPHFLTADSALADYYERPSHPSQRGDEFVTPRLVGPDPIASRITGGDAVIFYNYRGDRPRELTRAFVVPRFEGHVPPSPDSGRRGFERGAKLHLAFVSLTAYEEQLNEWVNVAFPKPPKMLNIVGDWLAQQGLKQFRCAETEKFPHVTFFFNDYRDEPFPGEDRAIIQSPRVATYDLQPEMNAGAVRDAVLDALDKDYALLLVNFANGDMVGHTGNLQAAIRAVETVDQCVGAIVDKAIARGGAAIVTADHGNAEQMWDPITNAPHTAHTTYDVECIVVDPSLVGHQLRSEGRLADVLPTALSLMGLPFPPEMTGLSLLRS